jgi:hypothetical protein
VFPKDDLIDIEYRRKLREGLIEDGLVEGAAPEPARECYRYVLTRLRGD